MYRFIKFTVLGLALAFSMTITGAAYADGAWVLTENGCKIWNPCPAPNEVVSWSGGADNENYASGKGTIQWLEAGNLVMSYEGDVVQGKANGKGVMTWPDGDRYDGDFAAGELTGKGVMTYADGDRYEGDFVNGQRKGYGTYYRCDGTTQQGQWDNDDFVG